jgi:hypothetical protein
VSTYTDKYASDVASAASVVRAAAAFYSQFSDAIDTYRGGMPAGMMAAIAIHESGGRMVAGDPNLGEFGFFQITSNFPTTVGIDPSVRTIEDGNIFLAGLEYNVTAAQMKLRYPDMVSNGSADQWMLARAVFALGIGAMVNLINLAKPSSPGAMFSDLVDFVDANPNVSVSGYAAGLVWYRIKSIPLQWQIGQNVVSQSPGIPVKVPAPYGMTYSLPKGVTLPEAAGGLFLALALGGALFWWLSKRS